MLLRKSDSGEVMIEAVISFFLPGKKCVNFIICLNRFFWNMITT